MRIGIYNRYWNTLGGGEKYAGTLAETFSEKHDVDLITTAPNNTIEELQRRLRLDLHRCRPVCWPNKPCRDLYPLSSAYDLFINATYCSSMPSAAPLSLYVCFFPHPVVGATTWQQLATLAGQRVRAISEQARDRMESCWSLLRRPRAILLAGYHDRGASGQGCFAGHGLMAIHASALSAGRLHIPLHESSTSNVRSVRVDGVPASWTIHDHTLVVEWPIAPIKDWMVLAFETDTSDQPKSKLSSKYRATGLCINTTTLGAVIDRGFRNRLFPPASASIAINSYTRILAISEFTSRWVQTRWNRTSELLPPSIDTDMFTFDPAVPRQPVILSVGRFFHGSHNKKHHEMARAFIRLRSEGVIPEGWRLRFIGSRHTDRWQHRLFFKKLERICAGHPIDILTDLPFPALLKEYQQAHAYWHAAGWGEKEDSTPELHEHFGITTCEAMACGCLPIVIDSAGQREIVRGVQQAGFLFEDYASLKKQMTECVSVFGTERVTTMRGIAHDSIMKYSKASFVSKAEAILRDLKYDRLRD
ncbi:MAG: glycosyltransferase [Verrucomicrobia bacterium]|nr:MAG: glycosyltransferase [Verrucomicrobiota bacterium]